MNKIKVGDTVRILDNSAYPYLTKDKLAIVEKIVEEDIGEELLVKELKEPYGNENWWISITSVEKV